MGTLGDNLLKLTEFPFSYSLIGLLVLVSGGGTLFEDASLEKIGPLLILMGFVATTLSITDPIGALQKFFLERHNIIRRTIRYHIFNHHKIRVLYYILFKRIVDYYERPDYDPWDRPRTVNVFGAEMNDALRGPAAIYKETADITLGLGTVHLGSLLILASLGASFLKELVSDPEKKRLSMYFKMTSITRNHTEEIEKRVLSLRDETLRTTWIAREIDKITSTIYFIIIISIFIPSLFFIPGFEDRFLATFQGGNQTLLIQHINAAKIAAEANDTGTAITETEEAEEQAKQLQDGYIRVLWAKVIIVIFSIGALLGILYRLRKRGRDLRDNAVTVFRYLVVREGYNLARRAIGIEKHTPDKGETFDKTLQAIEQYLTNGDWTLAGITVDQIISEYIDLLKTTLEDDEKPLGQE